MVKMDEYEITGKIVSGPFIKSESNTVEIFDMLGINRVATATFRYGHSYREAKGVLRIDPPGYSYSIEYYGDNPFERTKISEPFKSVEIEIEPARILDKKKKLGLNEKGYRFRGFDYHPPQYEAGIHISADRGKKETAAFVSAKAENYNDLDKFENAMEKLGFTDLKRETKKREVISFL
ncbi:MAG: hypothetical protein KKB25_02345 [Nanoarchaeota archaeon]|nr:hypothetical protein [Nanoarchaeota archaeon]